MQVALRRSYAAGGVALLGAGYIAMSPIAPPLPDLHLPSLKAPAVELTALPTWLAWLQTGTVQLQEQLAALGAGIQARIDDPLPIITQLIVNGVGYAQDFATAFNTSAGVIAEALVGLPLQLVLAIQAAIANPANIPAILNDLVTGLVDTVTDAVTPVVDAVTTVATTVFTHALGVADAIITNAPDIATAALRAPILIGTQVVDSTVAVLAAIATLRPGNVIGAIGQGLVDLEGATVGAITPIGHALRALQLDIADALAATPAPLAAASDPAAVPGPSAKMLTVNTGGTAGTAVTTPKAVTVAEEKPTPVRDAADRAVTISAQVARSSVEVRGVIVSAQGEVMTAAIDGAEGVAHAVINGGDVKEAVTTARTDVKGAMTGGRADVRAAVDKARDDIRNAAGGAMKQRVAAVSAKRSAASSGEKGAG